jgi:hypothetical protein
VTPVAIVSHSCEGAGGQLSRFSHWWNNDGEQMEIKHWQRMVGHKLVEHKVPKAEPSMDVSNAYVVDPSLAYWISKGVLTLPRMHETPKRLTQEGTVTSLPNESDHRPTWEVVISKTKARAGRKTIGRQWRKSLSLKINSS